MAQPRLFSVVIPHWNGRQHLPTCLDALRNQTYQPVEVIIVDNASTDGSQAFIRKHYRETRLLELPENRGFTGACNAGMQAARGDFVCLLNNDTEVEPTWAAEVVAAFDRHPGAGMIASKMLLFSQRDHIHTAGDYVRIDGLPGNRGVWQPDGPDYNEEIAVFSACGGSSTYRRALLDDVGLLDDDFFFSMEDIDLGWRSQLAGWTCIYAPKAIVYHHLAATGGGKTASFYDGRNTIWTLVKNYPPELWRKYRGLVIGAQWRRFTEALRAWRGEAARARMRGMIAGLLGLPRMIRKRRVIQSSRRVDAAYIESMLTPIPEKD